MKELYRIFNNVKIENHQVEETPLTEEETDIVLQRIRGKIAKTKKRKLVSNQLGIVASLILLVFIGTLFSMQGVRAEIQELSSNIVSYFMNKENKDVTNYTVSIGKYAVDHNISVLVKNIMIDNNIMTIEYEYDFSKVSKKERSQLFTFNSIPIETARILIDGKELEGVIGRISGDKNKYTAIGIFNMGNANSRDGVTAEIHFDISDVKNGKLMDGNWVLTCSISKDKIPQVRDEVTLHKNNSIQLDKDKVVTITGLKRTDNSIRVDYELKYSRIPSVTDGARLSDDMRLLDAEGEAIMMENNTEYGIPNTEYYPTMRGFATFDARDVKGNQFVVSFQGLDVKDGIVVHLDK